MHKEILKYLLLSALVCVFSAFCIKVAADEKKELFQKVTIYCPDTVTCTPVWKDAKRDCIPNVMPRGMSQNGMIATDYDQGQKTVYTFIKAMDWQAQPSLPTCYYEYKKSPTDIKKLYIVKDFPNTFRADFTLANLWVKEDIGVFYCATTYAKNCPMF